MSEAILNLTEDSFASAIATPGKIVVVDFWAPWCGPCKTIAPMLEIVAKELGAAVQITKVNVDDNQLLAQQYNVRAIPTLLFFKEGKLVDQTVGLIQKDALVQKIKAL